MISHRVNSQIKALHMQKCLTPWRLHSSVKRAHTPVNCALYMSELYEDNKKETLQRLPFKQSFLAGFLVHFNFPEKKKKKPLFHFFPLSTFRIHLSFFLGGAECLDFFHMLITSWYFSLFCMPLHTNIWKTFTYPLL